MIKRGIFNIVFFLVLGSPWTLGQVQGLKHPWMLFSNSDIQTIKTKLAIPQNNLQYQKLGYGSGLKYALYGDMADVASVKTNCYYPTLGARVRMVAGNSQGSFQWGRRMQDWLIPISLVINSSSFTQSEKDRLQLSCDSIAWRLRDVSYIEGGVGGPNNRTLDELMGVAFAGVFMFPDSPNASNHYAYVLNELERNLKYVKEDGAWPETSRYVGQVVIKCLVLFSQVQRRYLGNNSGLISDPRFKSILKTFMESAGTKDVLYKNRRYAPAIGDAGLGEANYQTLAWAAAEISHVDVELGKQLQGMWKMAGGEYLNNGNCLSYQLAVANADAPLDTTSVLPSVIQKNIGYYIFRNDYGKPTESNLITHLPDRNYYHRHYDCGSFSFYANNTPLLIDAGVGDYAEPDVSFYKSTCNHNVVNFKDANGLNLNGLDVGSQIVDTLLSDDYDFVEANITPPNNLARSYIRSTGYVKTLFNIVVIFDFVDTDNAHTNNFHPFSTSTDKVVRNSFNRTISHAYNNMDIEMTHLLPSINITLSKNKLHVLNIPSVWPRNLANTKDAGDLNNCYAEWIGVNNVGRSHYLTVIRPKKNADTESVITALTTDNSNCKAFKVDVTGKGSFIVVINTSSTLQSTPITFNSPEGLISLKRRINFIQNSSGKFDIDVPARSMEILMPKTLLPNAILTCTSNIPVKISPIPSSGVFTIDSECNGAKYTISNMQGQQIKSGKITQTHQSIDLTQCASGTYIIKFYVDNAIIVKKIIKN